MSVYTISLDYRGGTYLRQVEASNPETALLFWAKIITPSEIKNIGKKKIAKIINEISNDVIGLYEPVKVNGVVNVWCTGLPISGCIVDIIKTDMSQ